MYALKQSPIHTQELKLYTRDSDSVAGNIC